MSEALQKIKEKLAEKAKPEDKEKLQEELKQLNEIGVLEDLWHIYERIERKEIEVKQRNNINSLVAFVLGITAKKPDGALSVPKRRTYGRSGFPDVDMDFCYLRRHEIMDYLVEKYGREYVGNIGTVQTLQTKAAIRRVIKVLDPENTIRFDSQGKIIKDSDTNRNYELENAIAKTLPKMLVTDQGEKIKSVKQAYETYPEFRAYMDQYPEVYEASQHMEGKIQGYGIHAAGVVISPMPLSEICPLHVTTTGPDSKTKEPKEETRGRKEKGSKKNKKKNKDKDVALATQFSMAEVESLGLIKFDVLGLSTKTAIDWTVADLEAMGRKLPPLDNLPKDDEKTLSLIRSGETVACFQLESPGMQKTLREISIDSFDDLIVAVAMFRPGPLQYISLYADRKHGKAQVTYPHHLMKKITEKTQGIMCFQEQVMQVFMTLAGLTATDGYKFMKGCAKKKRDLIEVFKDKFARGALANGVEKSVVEKIWSDLERFSGYAFNKSHAASYAYEAYKTAYLKAHFPLQFMCNRLSIENIRRNFDLVKKFEGACEESGITFEPPDINHSKIKYVISDERAKRIRRPLLIKGIGIKAAEEIVKHQPFKTNDILFDFGSRVGPAVNTRVMEVMREEGMWDFLGKSARRDVVQRFELIKKDVKRHGGKQINDLFNQLPNC